MSSINKCPKCGYSSDMAFEECPKCGVITKKIIEIQNRQEKQKRIEELEKRLCELEKIDTPSKPRYLREKAKFFVGMFVLVSFFCLSSISWGWWWKTKKETVVTTMKELVNFPQDFEGKNVVLVNVMINHEIKKSAYDFYFLDVGSSGGTRIFFDSGTYGKGGISLVVYENLARKMVKEFIGENYSWRGCKIECDIRTSKSGKSYFGVVKRITLSGGTVFED